MVKQSICFQAVFLFPQNSDVSPPPLTPSLAPSPQSQGWKPGLNREPILTPVQKAGVARGV